MKEKKAEQVVEPVKLKLTNEQRNELKRKRRARLQDLKAIQKEGERLRAENRVQRLEDQRALRRLRKELYLETKAKAAEERRAEEAKRQPLVIKQLGEAHL